MAESKKAAASVPAGPAVREAAAEAEVAPDATPGPLAGELRADPAPVPLRVAYDARVHRSIQPVTVGGQRVNVLLDHESPWFLHVTPALYWRLGGKAEPATILEGFTG